MEWLWLFLAGLAEIGWMIGLKFSEGFTRLWWSVAMLASMALSMFCLALAIRSIPMGTAYAIWTGIGAAGIALIGIYFFGEPRTALRLGCIALIVLGILGLKASS
ncbi:MAG: DMT family transporter [Chlamydiia bacterium]